MYCYHNALRNSPGKHTHKIHTYAYIIAAAWTVVIICSFSWYYYQHTNEVLSIGRAEAEAAFGRDVLYRRWSTWHGGVYVPVTPETPPNPYLAHVPERDITTPSGKALTLINPAYMTRQVYEMANREERLGRGHITSLKTLRPENRPDPWEEKALRSFETGVREVLEVQILEGKAYMRLIRPIFTEKGCLKCHGIQGYREGDIRGGISVSVPISAIKDVTRKQIIGGAVTHGFLWVLGLGALGVGARKLSTSAVALLESEQRYRELTDNLHLQTAQLEEEIAERQVAKEALQEQAAMLEEEITERRVAQDENERLQSQLLQAQKMESIGRLAGGVAHDFNNMLTVILGYTEMSKRLLPEGHRVRDNLREIMKAAERSRDITRQLLAFSRKEVISPKPVDLNRVILDTEKSIARLIGEDIILRFHPGIGLWLIKIDPSQIDQIFVNLAVNARDAMPNGGNLTIETDNTRIDKAFCSGYLDIQPGEYVQLTISDSGIGMDRETQSHIFEPFFTTKELGKGTGLGLATVYGIVTQNNGFINVYSEPGHGTTFKVYFPRLLEVHAMEMTSAQPSFAGSGTVLLVEDDETVRRMTIQMLETMGYRVLQADTPQKAIDLCEQMGASIDIILTDVIMPGMNGKQMYEKIASIRPGIRVLFMSGYSSDVIVQRGVIEEGMHFIQKPFDMNSLNHKIGETLRS